jgi:prophage regulatory protein
MNRKKLLRLKHVLEKVPFSRSHLHVLINEDKFPKPHKIGRNSFWLESDIDNWIAEACNLEEAAA